MIYYGTKRIEAEPDNSPSGVSGYKVTYADGYKSFSPKEVFEASYRENGRMSFGHALEALREGRKVARSGWNGKGMFLFVVPGSVFSVNRAPLLGIYPVGTEITYHSHIDMRTAQGIVVPWVASQSDLLEEDWSVVD